MPVFEHGSAVPLLSFLQRLLAIETTEVRDTLREAALLVAQALKAEKADVFLLDQESQTLVALGVSETPLGHLQRSIGLDRLPLANRGRTVAVFQTGTSYYSGHVDADADELPGVKEGIGVRLGMLVEVALEQTLQAVQDPDITLCEHIIASDLAIDVARREVERLAFRSLALHQPLAGRDLRFLASTPLMTAYLERAADNAAGIATLLLRILALHKASPLQFAEYRTTETAIIKEVLALGEEAKHLLHETLRAFEANDENAARFLWQEDDVVDVRYHLIRHEVMRMLRGTDAVLTLQHDSQSMQRMTYWLWIAHNLERIGDHCTNICERIVFFAEGNATLKSASM